MKKNLKGVARNLSDHHIKDVAKTLQAFGDEAQLTGQLKIIKLSTHIFEIKCHEESCGCVEIN